MLPLRIVAVVVMVVLLPFTTTRASHQSYGGIIEDYENPEERLQWGDTVTEMDENKSSSPMDKRVKEWIQKQLARPINQPVMEKLVEDMESGRVDDEYWDDFVDELKLNEELEEEEGWIDEDDEEEDESADEKIGTAEFNSNEEDEDDSIEVQETNSKSIEEEEEEKKSSEEYENKTLSEEERQESKATVQTLQEGEDFATSNEGLEDEEIDEELIKTLVQDFDFSLGCVDNCEEEMEEGNSEKLLTRLKRSPIRRSSSRSRSSSSRSSSSRRSSSSSSGGGWWGRRSSSTSSSSSRPRVTTTSTSRNTYGTSSGSGGTTSNTGSTGVTSSTSIGRQPPPGWNTGSAGARPGSTYPTSTNPQSGYPGARPGGTYPTSTNPQSGYPGARPGSTYPTGPNPQPGYPGARPGGTYPTNTNPQPGYPGARPGSTYPTGTNPQPGYPGGVRPGSTYPTSTNPQSGYPGARPGSTYPTGTNPLPGYPGGVRPGSTYPTSTNPQSGYPGARPGSTYPTGTNPQPGYPGARPGGNYPTSTNPQPGYPGYRPGSTIQAAPGYPAGSQPFGVSPVGSRPYGPPTTSYHYGGFNSYGQPRTSYPGAFQPYGGFPTSTRHMGYGAAAGGMMGASRFTPGGFGGYPVGGYPKPVKVKKKGLKNKIKDGLKVAATAYAVHKVTKKAKFFSPSHFGGYGYGYGHGMGGFGHGMGGFGHRMGGFGYSMGGYGHGLGGFGHGLGGKLAGGLAGVAIAKTGKKLLGAYIKLKIAKYALKFGAEAAKAYFMYKMGLELDEYMIAKFVHRYHQHRVRGDNRWRYYEHHNRYRNGNNGDNSTVQQDDITLGEFCQRPCADNDTRICQFSFDVHLYQTMSRACYQCPTNQSHCELPECVAVDGTRRMIVTVNKGIPGPAIQVCAGDKVIVDVMNNHPSMAVSFHWHGLTLAPTEAYPGSRRTPYMDGTTGVSQCPIPPGSGLRYSFYATNPGTHFWRAQTGVQRGDGLYGPLIVHQTQQKDPNQFLAEHVVVLSDWYHKSQDALYANQQTSGKLQTPASLLINGKGAKVDSNKDKDKPTIPPARFMVQNGTRYRLRVISATSSNCPMTLSVDGHELILLAVDGAPVSPVNSTTLLIYPGERYDAMFSAEQGKGEGGNVYWITVKGGGACANLSQYAALQYFPTNFTLDQEIPQLPPMPTTPIATSGQGVFNGKCDTEGQRCIPHLSSALALPGPLKAPRVTHTFYLALTLSLVHNPHYYNLLYYDGSEDQLEDLVKTPQINYLSFRLPPKPLLNNPRPLRSENCSVEAVRINQCVAGYCECLHTLTVAKGSTVDLVLIADVYPEGPNEPIHLHGYKFWVLSQVWPSELPPDPPTPAPPTTTTPPPSVNGTTPEPPPPPPPPSLRDKVVAWDERGELTRKLTSPVQKDTVAVPPGGYAIIRFTADNPGVWLLESEVAFQSQGGMALVVQVEGAEKDIPPNAPIEFPTC